LRILKENAKVTLLSVITDKKFIQRFSDQVDEIIELPEYPESRVVLYLREVIDYAHYRWLWTEKVKNKWEILDSDAITLVEKTKHTIWKAIIYLFANRFSLSILSFLENQLSLWLKPTNDFDELFDRIKPDLVFNCSHIHASRGELPVRVAHKMGISTAAFIFSWDNLSSRGRILPPYDYYFVWHHGMRDQLLSLYPYINKDQAFITGTPQFDYHFQPEYCLTRADLSSKLGLDPSRPFVLYTTGMDSDFPQEYRHVQTVIDLLAEYEDGQKPQLVVRMYVKGNSPEMKALSQKIDPDVVFPPILWEEKWFTPQYEDLAIYTSLLHHASFGINPASTVSLELMMLDKPVINLGFDPQGSNLPNCYRWKRHIDFDHYRQVADSGAVLVAYSQNDMREMIHFLLDNPTANSEIRHKFIREIFDNTLDGNSGKRVALKLIETANKKEK
jgi:hypothetical protein